jgi:hypothetical protein
VSVKRRPSRNGNYGELVVAIGVVEMHGDDEAAGDIETGDVASFGDGELKNDLYISFVYRTS